MKLLTFAFAALLGVTTVANTAHAARPNACLNLFGPKRIFQDSSGARLVFEAHGPQDANEVVIFLNGIDKDLHQWDFVRRRVEAQRSDALFVQVDLLGEGDSAKLNPSRSTIPFEDQIALIHSMIEQNGWTGKRIILAGHSYGGGIAARYVRDFPGTISDAILIDPFVDDLETHQPGVGPMMAIMKEASAMMGMKSMYDFAVLSGSSIGMAATWAPYSMMNGAKGTLPNVLALTRGNRDLQMTRSVQMAGSTKIHLLPSAMSEMIPPTAHVALWRNVPATNKGILAILPTTHDSISMRPDLVAKQILRVF